MEIRKATFADLDEIMNIIKSAQAFMIANNNPHQWRSDYPTREIMETDLRNGDCYLICDDYHHPHATFSFIIGIEPTYDRIEDGQWLNNLPYGTLHRLASDGNLKGIFSKCFSFITTLIDNIRCDTHHDNSIMQRLLYENEFKKCGIIHVEHDGTARLAFQWYQNKEDK